jgi:RHS repeat-associated protein
VRSIPTSCIIPGGNCGTIKCCFTRNASPDCGISIRRRICTPALTATSTPPRPLAESDSGGNNPVEYVFFAGARIARRDASGNVTYYFSDQIGTTRTLTDATGHLCYDADFYPFGGERTPYVNTCSQSYKFAGMERDSETQNDHTMFRYYASNTGRWLSPDPLAGDVTNPQLLNRYAYVANNPTNFVDPQGLRMSLPGCTPFECDNGGGGGWFPGAGWGNGGGDDVGPDLITGSNSGVCGVDPFCNMTNTQAGMAHHDAYLAASFYAKKGYTVGVDKFGEIYFYEPGSSVSYKQEIMEFGQVSKSEGALGSQPGQWVKFGNLDDETQKTLELMYAGGLAAPFVSGKGIATWYGVAASGPVLVYGVPAAIEGASVFSATHPFWFWVATEVGSKALMSWLKNH